MVKELRYWFELKKGNILNFRGVCQSIGLSDNALGDFVNEGYISKNAFVKALGFALELGFKLYENQTYYDLKDKTLTIYTREVVSDVEVIETEIPLDVSKAWEQYDKERKASEQPEQLPQKRRVVKKKQNDN